MLDHYALDTYGQDLRQRRLAEVAADRLADLAAVGRPRGHPRLAALLRAIAARLEPETAPPVAMRGRLLLE